MPWIPSGMRGEPDNGGGRPAADGDLAAKAVDVINEIKIVEPEKTPAGGAMSRLPWISITIAATVSKATNARNSGWVRCW